MGSLLKHWPMPQQKRRYDPLVLRAQVAEKQRNIFAIRNTDAGKLPFEPESITDVDLTHLHFDHAGGISKWASGGGKIAELCYPQAKIWLQQSNFENAQNPSPRERASYLK